MNKLSQPSQLGMFVESSCCRYLIKCPRAFIFGVPVHVPHICISRSYVPSSEDYFEMAPLGCRGVLGVFIKRPHYFDVRLLVFPPGNMHTQQYIYVQ